MSIIKRLNELFEEEKSVHSQAMELPVYKELTGKDGFMDDSTAKIYQNGNFRFRNPETKTEYTVHSNGYVRVSHYKERQITRSQMQIVASPIGDKPIDLKYGRPVKSVGDFEKKFKLIQKKTYADLLTEIGFKNKKAWKFVEMSDYKNISDLINKMLEDSVADVNFKALKELARSGVFIPTPYSKVLLDSGNVGII